MPTINEHCLGSQNRLRLLALTFTLSYLVSRLFQPVLAGNSQLNTVQSPQKSIALTISSRNDSSVAFYHDLLQQALALGGYQAKITFIGSLSYLRQVNYLKHGKIDLIWRLGTKERDQAFTRIDVGLTHGMIGQRIFLIPKGDQWKYDDINNLADFIEHGLTGGFGEKWFDIEIWKYNQLPYVEIPGDNNKIYPMLASKRRNIDYLSRGMNEIIGDARLHQDLEIEQRLLFIYQKDTYFYLGPSAIQYQSILEHSLRLAEKTGLIKTLIYKHWGNIDNLLQLDKRKKIHLKMPPADLQSK
ncbi:hypothetical protein [Thalassomonas haliotis]|uniref:Solute-binding protein family 3/N-terminal domain-containing protein n=1 Tax=Thalassomonas haliotis TaxID=485448 RepID=A0ABY7VBX5_9GAMM|nr:hypothetical protein [Thalassomonas haliotis]WDE10599.1 hypothetical protein H3N35_20405 [Thalassomonas haliotis]